MALMRRRMPWCRRAALLALAPLFAQGTSALEGGAKAPHGHFGIVGSFALNRAGLGTGFSGVQIAPKWVLTAAHAAPPPGAIFVDDCGMSGVAEVLTFPFKVPTQTPLAGALRDDLALVRLAAAVECPYFPRLADDTALPAPGVLPSGAYSVIQTTLVSNNPSMTARRFGHAQFLGLFRVPGYDLLLIASDKVALVVGDSGSPVFLGHLSDTDQESVLAGVASAQGKGIGDRALGIYTRVGPYRALLDGAVEATGEKLRWYTVAPGAALSFRDEGSP